MPFYQLLAKVVLCKPKGIRDLRALQTRGLHEDELCTGKGYAKAQELLCIPLSINFVDNWVHFSGQEVDRKADGLF